MYNIGFEPNSLLYGESCLWLYTFLVIPFQLWPDLKNTKTKHVLEGTWFASRILNNPTRWHLTRFIQLLAVYLITSCQLLYATLTVIYGSAVQESHLLFLNKHDPEELAYKCLYYTPLLIRLATSFTLIASYIYRSRYIEWETFDHFKIFAINSWRQTKIMALCVLIVTPNCIRLWVDMLFLIAFLRSEQYNMLQFTLRSREANLIFQAFVLFMNASSAVFQYKPVVVVIYSEICLILHLRVLHDKLDIVYNGKTGKSEADTAPTWMASKQQALQESNDVSAPALRAHRAIIEGEDGSDVYSRLRDQRKTSDNSNENRTQNNTVEIARSRAIALKQYNDTGQPGKSDKNVGLKIRPKIVFDERKQSRASTITLAQVEECCDAPLAKLGEYRISCLFEFERHLTQLSLFAAAIDQQTPSIVYATLITNAMGIFYSILYLREIPTKDLNFLYVVLYLATPTLPLYALFKCGQAIEKERDRISTLIEIFHWNSTSHLMVYKQFKSTQHSLRHVFKLLNSIQFNCDNLMGINMKNYWTILLYISGAVFIVVQYDFLLDTHKRFPLAINGTILGSATTNKTLAWRDETSVLDTRYQPSIFG